MNVPENKSDGLEEINLDSSMVDSTAERQLYTTPKLVTLSLNSTEDDGAGSDYPVPIGDAGANGS